MHPVVPTADGVSKPVARPAWIVNPACVPSRVGAGEPEEPAGISSGARCVVSRDFTGVRIRLVFRDLLTGRTNWKAV